MEREENNDRERNNKKLNKEDLRKLIVNGEVIQSLGVSSVSRR
jgi:hypothetical protein